MTKRVIYAIVDSDDLISEETGMYFNLIHKPMPKCHVHNEAFLYQRECAHSLGLKLTNFIHTNYLTDEYIIDLVKEDRQKYGDEIALLLWALDDMPDTMPWLLSTEDKRRLVKYSVEKFKEAFGSAPKAISQYVLDAELISIIKEYCPECTVGTVGCFEEGVKVFHGCNNSWYLFSEGMPWNPWYPSKDQSMRPAENKEEWAGMLALPHLNRDLVLSYEGRNDFFASHPANIQRALANDGYVHDYDYNLIDAFRMQEDYNDGYSYYQINVSPGWLANNMNVIDPDEITRTLYKQTLEYVASLRDEGALIDMTLSEFADWYTKNVPIGKTEVAVAKDILYGSGKHYFWVVNSDYRVLIDTHQGGSIGDLRPYLSKYSSFTGVDSPSLAMNSYPYLIQSQYRSGAKHHYHDGARTTLFVKHGDEEIDLCAVHTKVKDVKKENDSAVLTLTPATVRFKDGLTLDIETRYSFAKNGVIEIEREILTQSADADDLTFEEYVKGCFGFTEYPEKMTGIKLLINNKWVGDYKYSAKAYSSSTDNSAGVIIPDVSAKLTLIGEAGKTSLVTVEDGHLFSPFYVLRTRYDLSNEKRIKTCLKMEMA